MKNDLKLAQDLLRSIEDSLNVQKRTKGEHEGGYWQLYVPRDHSRASIKRRILTARECLMHIARSLDEEAGYQ